MEKYGKFCNFYNFPLTLMCTNVLDVAAKSYKRVEITELCSAANNYKANGIFNSRNFIEIFAAIFGGNISKR